MEDKELRLECLRLAKGTTSNRKEIVEIAKEFEQYVNEPAQKSETDKSGKAT